MFKRKTKKAYKHDGQDRLLPKLSLFIFDRSRTAAILWLCLTVFGAFSYTTFLKKEGFPSIDIPYSVVGGAYFANDAQQVDQRVTQPISELALKDKRVKSVQATAQANQFVVVLQYAEGTNAEQAGKEIAERIDTQANLPAQATVKVETPKLGFTERGDDGIVTVYAKKAGAAPEALQAEAQKLANFLKDKKLAEIESVSAIASTVSGVDPLTGQQVTSRQNFDRYGVRNGNETVFYDAAAVGFTQKEGTDVIQLNDKIEAAVSAYNRQNQDSPFRAVVTATYAHDIQDQIGELQKALLEGLLAVLVIGSIIIAIRASLITVIAMLTVLAITLGVLLLVGYTLNTITLFALILCLGLIVDDTIIMVEALDAQRRRRKDAREVVHVATRKVSRAMVAATLTAALSFAPLLFVGGILGGFIRAIPITVITSLLVSLAVALVFIPLFARYLLLGKKQLGEQNVHEPAARVEAKIAAFVGKPMLWARHSKRKLFGVGIAAIVFAFVVIGAGGMIFQKVAFNIFPPTKDSNGLFVQMQFAPGTTIEQAEATADRANKILADKLGDNFRYGTYYQGATSQQAMLSAQIIPYSDREVRAPELVDQLNAEYKSFKEAKVTARQMDIGPPASAFKVRVQTDDRQAAQKLASALNTFLSDKELVRPSGEKAKVTEVTVSDPGTYVRADNKLYMEVSANFDGDDTSTLVTLAKDAIDKEFTESKLQNDFDLPKDALAYDLGQEQENQDSFAALTMAFPILLVAIYILLAIQFRSLLQPLLIFTALPFSFFGIALGLYLTDNAFSFFAMLGFFALIGLSIKNTILLTDYANQLRREGMPAVDAAVGALGERFRPLIATSLTAVVSLIPLALSSPFWEGLAVVLIFGLLSSTLLVITVFPYFYLGAEYLRMRISRKAGLTWVAVTVALMMLLAKLKADALVLLAPVFTTIIAGIIARLHRHRLSR